METKEVKLSSGATLEIQPSPFGDAKDLWQAVLSEAKGTKFNPDDEVDVNFIKDIFCIGFSSKLIEEKVWKCMQRCKYNGLKITKDTFEPLDARKDYVDVCLEVAQFNVLPFVNSLYVDLLKRFQGAVLNTPKQG